MIHLKEYNNFDSGHSSEGEEIIEILNRFSLKINKDSISHLHDSPKDLFKIVIQDQEYSGDLFRELFPISYEGDIEKRLDLCFWHSRFSSDVAYLYFRIIDFINDCLYEVEWEKI